MPSDPERGPTRMSTFSCSTSRRASSTALSGVESEPPYRISIGCPARTAFSTPSVGSPLTGVAPRLISGSIAPPHVWPSNGAKAPSLFEKMPILMGSPVASPVSPVAGVVSEPSSGEEDDGEEDDTDDGVEASADDVDSPGPVVQNREGERSHPGALEPVEAADHRDHEHVDRPREVDRPGRDAGVPPDGEDPGQRGDQRAEAERAHAGGIVPDALERQSEGRAPEVADEQVDGRGRAQRDVKEVGRVGDRIRDDVRAVDVVHAAEAGELRHLAEEEEREDGEGERDHQEVDPVAPARDRAEEEPDSRADEDPRQGSQPGVPGDGGAAVGRDEVRHREAGDSVEGDLSEGDHARVAREEDQAGRCDPEPERLRDHGAQVEVGEEQRAEEEDEHDRRSRRPPERRLYEEGRAAQAGLPKSPSGRTASTSTSSPKMSSTE